MNQADKLAMVRTMVEQPNVTGWTDEVLNVYLDIAGAAIIGRAYPYDVTVTEVPSRYGYLQCVIATYLLNKRGAEGETSHSENGIARTYESASIPESFLSEVIPYCGVIR